MRNVPGSSSPSARGVRKALRELGQALQEDGDDHVTRFALVRLLAKKGDYLAAEELLRAPGVEEKLLADPTTHVAMLSSLGGAYLMLWKACREEPSGGGTPRGGRTDTRESLEFRIDLSAPRMELLHQAQRFLGEALTAPENFNDPVIRAQLGYCKEARGDCNEALALYASIISDSPLSCGTSTVIFRTSVLLAHVGRINECVRYLEFIEEEPPQECSKLLVQALLYTCYVAMSLQKKASRRLLPLREAFNDEYIGGRIGARFSRQEIPWDRLPGWFPMWRELGEQSLRKGDYYLGVQMLAQATLHKEDAETLVRTAEMLWMLRDAKGALKQCERAYAADPEHVRGKQRLSAWAPEKWRDRIVKEEERRKAVQEIRRLAELSVRKANAMIARRARREKTRVLRAWRRVHAKCKARLVEADGGESSVVADTSIGSSSYQSKASIGVSSPSASSPSGSSSSSPGSKDDSSSSSSLSISTLSSEESPVAHAVGSIEALFPPPTQHSFPVPSAAAAVRAGRDNFLACFRAELSHAENARRDRAGGVEEKLASVEVARTMTREAMLGENRDRGFYTPEMRALARFRWHRKTHEARNTRAIYKSKNDL